MRGDHPASFAVHRAGRGRQALTHCREHARQRLFGGIDPPLELLERIVDAIGALGQRVHGCGGCIEPTQARGEVPEPSRRELRPERTGCDPVERVRLVEHHDVVLREHVATRREMRAIQRVIHDEHVDLGGLLARRFGKAGRPLLALARRRGTRSVRR